jgi:hypothetical protein
VSSEQAESKNNEQMNPWWAVQEQAADGVLGAMCTDQVNVIER